jgi:hypothetical protein
MGARIDARSHLRAAPFAGAIFAIATAIAACSSESNPKPPDNNFTTSSGTTSGSDSTTTSASGTGGDGSATSSTGSSASTGTGAGGGGTGGAPPSCDGVNGCYSCPPKTGNQLLNACTGSQCSPFDNVARLPLYNSGNLPAIP